MRYKIFSILLLLASFASYAHSENTQVACCKPDFCQCSDTKRTLTEWLKYDPNTQRPWSVLGYVGFESSTTLGQIFGGNYEDTNGRLYAGEVAYALPKDNIVQNFLSSIVDRIELTGNVAYLDGGNNPRNIYEFNPYVMFRWTHFPWNNHLNTTLGIGEGVSYATRVPVVETRNADETAHFLNFLIVEATFSLPKHPEWQLVTRIHHRSGAYGLYGAGNSGSNIPAIGIRYLFD